MPMSDASGRWWITYNGEVYNFETVREELLRLGHSFRSRTDTEVILHAYMEWGEECMDRFVGMFAFAILDTQRAKSLWSAIATASNLSTTPAAVASAVRVRDQGAHGAARAAAGGPAQPARMVALPQRRP